ncbi:demethoxyubiquinone hydroxylase family protein [Dehalobacter sp. DCM]|uniref:demethoxyubiquinone hydroxylase family protein n=1 Tax=Dehalobacter sp. DCM TaxID=2907827 RepID=UPI003081B78D|nr:demethoxyubiquinone hydroxylase family protein [Dehalobacter sp. DCM]
METYHIRGPVEPQDIRFRCDSVDPLQLANIRSGLKKLHTFEIMAVNIYKFQITKQKNALNQIIIQAMGNEMTHVQDFQIKLYEYGARPGTFRWTFWLAGMIIGLTSRLLGKNAMIKAGIWTEQKAVTDYQKIIQSASWDSDTLAVITHNLQDEYHHIETLQGLLNT